MQKTTAAGAFAMGMFLIADPTSARISDDMNSLKKYSEFKHKYVVEAEMEAGKNVSSSFTFDDFQVWNINTNNFDYKQIQKLDEKAHAHFLSLAQDFSDSQVELDPIFLDTLNKLSNQTGNASPSKRRF